MTPEQLEDIREWAEWGNTTPSHMMHALLDHVDALTKRVESLEAGQGVRQEMIRTAIVRLAAVRELHVKDCDACETCSHPGAITPWPCPTIQALDSDQ